MRVLSIYGGCVCRDVCTQYVYRCVKLFIMGIDFLVCAGVNILSLGYNALRSFFFPLSLSRALAKEIYELFKTRCTVYK